MIPSTFSSFFRFSSDTEIARTIPVLKKKIDMKITYLFCYIPLVRRYGERDLVAGHEVNRFVDQVPNAKRKKKAFLDTVPS